MFMGLGMPIPDLSNKPGPGRPGWGPAGTYDFQFEVTGAVTIKANAAGTGNFRVSWPNGTTQVLSGNNSSVAAPDGTAGIVSINNEKLDTTYADEFAVVGGKTNVSKVISWGSNAWSNLQDAFNGCTNLTHVEDAKLLAGSSCTLFNLFRDCTGLVSAICNKWDLSLANTINSMFRGCSNLELIDFSGAKIGIQGGSLQAFSNIGTSTTNGCEFKFTGLEFTNLANHSTNYLFGFSKIKPSSSFANIKFPATEFTSQYQWFYSSEVTGTNSVLDCSGWTTFNGNLASFWARLNNPSAGVSPTNTNLKVNLTNFSGKTSSINGFVRDSAISGIIGLSTWGATDGTAIDFTSAFHNARVFAMDASDNFSNTFISSCNVSGISSFYNQTGNDYNGTLVYGAAPNLTNLNCANITSFASIFNGAKLTSNPDFNSITYPSTAISFSSAFSEIRFQTYSGSHIDFSTATLKISSLSSAFRGYSVSIVEKLTFGDNVDFSQLTSFNLAFYNFGRGPGNAFPTEITLPTNADYSSVTSTSNMFYNTNFPYTTPALSTCQVDYFIRNLYSSRQSLGSGGALTINMPGMSITGAPSSVRSRLDYLITLGYNITLGATDTTLPFTYASYAVDPTGLTTISPTTTPPAGSVFTATNSLNIDSSTGVITIGSFRGGSTIRCTYPDGCYNEVVMLIQVPFVMRTIIPANNTVGFELKPQMSAGECFVDWGDNSSQILTANTTHAYPSSSSDETYDISIFDSPSGSKFTGFTGNWAGGYGVIGSATYDKSIMQWGEIEWQNNSWFRGASTSSISNTNKLRISAPNGAAHKPNLSQVTSLANMFFFNYSGGLNFVFEDVNNNCADWDVSTITDMSKMFHVGGAPSTRPSDGQPNTLQLSNWDVSNVTNFSEFGMGHAFNQSDKRPNGLGFDITNWNTAEATNFSSAFRNKGVINGLENLNTSKVTNMYAMFMSRDATYPDLKTKVVNGTVRWSVKKVTNFGAMFGGTRGGATLTDSTFPTNWWISGDGQDVNMAGMFGHNADNRGSFRSLTDLNAFATKTIASGSSPYGSSYTAWDMSKVTSLQSWAYNGQSANMSGKNWNIGTWQISNKCTNLQYMLASYVNSNVTYSIDQDLGHWDVTNVTAISYWMANFRPNRMNEITFSTANYDSLLDITDGWGQHAGSVQSGVTLNMGASKYSGNNAVIGAATVNGTSTNLIASGNPFTSSMVGGIVTITSGTNNNEQAKITTYNSPSSVTISRGINRQTETNTFTVDTTDAAKGRFALSDPDGPAWIITDGGKEVVFNSFKMQVRVPNGGLNFSFAKITSPSNVNATINWGDGQSSTINTVNSIPTHTYTNSTGSDVIYEIELNQGSDSAYCTGFRFDDNLDATSRAAVENITQWGDTSWVNMASAFKTCANLDVTATDGPVITSNTNLTHSFGSCTSLVNSNGSIGNWNVSQLTALYVTFDGCTSFNVDISKWDTSNLGNMNNSFLNCTSFNQDLSTKYITAGNSPTGSAYWAWNTSSVNNMIATFKGATNFNCGSNANGLSNWNTSSVTTMFEMFESSGYNKPLNTNLVPAASSYSGSDYVAWDVDNVTDFREMFRDNTSFNQDIGKWKFKATGTIAFNYMLKGATAFAQDISTKTITAGNSPYGTQYTAWDVSRASSLTRVIAGTNVNVLLNWDVGQWSTYALHSWGGASAAGGLSVANYTDQIVKWANGVNAAGKIPTGIYAVINSDGATVPNYDSTRTYGSGFANAGRARSYLSLDVTVSGSGDSSVNGVYYYDYGEAKWVRENDANIQIAWNGDESVWELSVEGEATNSGSGGSQAGGPTSVTSWSGGISVTDSSAGWTFNGTVTT